MSVLPVSRPAPDAAEFAVAHDSDAPAPSDLERVELFGLDFIDAPSIDHVVDALLATAPVQTEHIVDDSSPLPIVVTPNVDHLIHLDRQSNEVAGDMAARASFVLPDGQPIVWASKLLYRPLTTRLAGSSLVEQLWPRIIAEGRRGFVVSSAASTAECVDREGEHLACTVAPMLDLSDRAGFDAFIDDTTRKAADHGSQFVFVGLGFPKQCNIIDGMIRAWPADRPLPMFLAIGASFEMYYQFVKRAPTWMQKSGLEWLFRFSQEPRRLFKRYFVDDVAFIGLVARSWRSRRHAAI